jgi:antitoxin component YwqK of YwqJK toxin-antitoxin module
MILLGDWKRKLAAAVVTLGVAVCALAASVSAQDESSPLTHWVEAAPRTVPAAVSPAPAATPDVSAPSSTQPAPATPAATPSTATASVVATPAPARPVAKKLRFSDVAAQARAKAKAGPEPAVAAAQADEPDWAKDYDGHASGDIVTPAKPRRWLRSEWRANRYPDGRTLTEWEVRLAATDDPANPTEAVRWGVYRRYHPNGRLAVLGAYRNGKAAGEWVWLDESGQVLRRAKQTAEYQDDLANDPLSSPNSTFRNTAGVVIAEGQLKQDKPHGLWTYSYDNGAPKAQGRYLSGLPEGLWSYFYPDGELEKQMTYALGVPIGPYRVTFPSGLDRERGQYDAGVRTGVWRTFFDDGRVREEGAYREDRRDGEWKAWNDDGLLVTRTIYTQGAVTQTIAVPPPPAPPGPMVSDVEALNPPVVFDDAGHPVKRVEAWDNPANATDADGNPIPLTPPRRKAPPPSLSRWTSPTSGQSKATLP